MAELHVKVVPGASRTELVGRHGEGIRVRVAAAPEGGKANRAVMSLLAELLGLAPSAVSIVRGETSPQKVVRFEGIDAAEVWARLRV